MLGFLLTPDMGNKVPEDCIVAGDNACFSNPEDYSDDRFLTFLEKMPRDRTLFAVAPDVLEDHVTTIERSIPMCREIRKLGFKAAFVAQDGFDDAPWDEFDCLFVGGSTGFKFRGGRHAVKAAKQHGKSTHMGRVNSLDRLRAAVGIGCDSADGTYLKFGPDTNAPKLLRWLETINEQHQMMTA